MRVAVFEKAKMDWMAVKQQRPQSRHMAGCNRRKVSANALKTGAWHDNTNNTLAPDTLHS